jgi:hypothetical protein
MNPSLPVDGGASLLHQVKTTALVDGAREESDNDDDDDSSWDEDSDDEEDDSDDSEPIMATSNLLGMTQQHPIAATSADLLGFPQQQQPPVSSYSQPSHSNGNYSHGLQGLEGLVMAPVVVEAKEKVNPDVDRDSSAWMDLLRPELAGGLAVKARYLRGPTRDREAQLIGLDPSSPTVVVLQLHFQNMRTDLGVLRRVRVVSRSTTSGNIGPKRSVLPQEILALNKDMMTMVILGLEFVSASDRNGTLQARFDLKSDRGSHPLDLRPPLTELVKPLVLNANAFDENMNRLQGFQRVTSKFAIPAGEVANFDSAILKQVALRPLDNVEAWKTTRRLRLVGQLPVSIDKVFILVQCSENGSGTLTVCCDNAIATNSILDSLKKALK